MLRTFAGGVTAAHGGFWLAQSAGPSAAVWAVGLLAILSGLALVAGVFTPGAALTTAVSMLFLALHIDRVVALLVIVDAVALALLGPGAHSIDAYLFGRREIIIPRSR